MISRKELDINHRFFTDDIAYGICIAKWIAQQMAFDVPTMDAIIKWSQELRGENYISDGKLLPQNETVNGCFRSGIPPVYGMQTIEDIMD